MRIKTERKLVTMLNAEQLATLSNDELAKEYQRICGTETQVVEENKSTIIEELIAQAQADAAKETPTEGKESTMTAQKKSSKAKKPAAKKESAAKKAAPKAKAAAPSKKDAAKKPVAKKESAPKAAKSSGNGADNPFREGTMKAKGFDLFRKAGKDAEPSDLIEKIIKLGATPSTARSWLQVYRQQ
jgi:flagellar biosynthesis GTPase FlhF